jgi:hypothetical protein
MYPRLGDPWRPALAGPERFSTHRVLGSARLTAVASTKEFHVPTIKTAFHTLWSVVGRNLLAAAISWLLMFFFVQLGQRGIGGWFAPSLGQAIGCVAGVGVALALRARLVALLAAGFAAFSLSELVAHGYYGIRAVQGAPTLFAVMGAGVLGVTLGMLLASRRGHNPALGS